MYYSKLSDLGIKLTRHNGNEKTKCPQCSDSRKNKNDKPLSVNITTGEYNCFSGDTRVLTKYGVYPIIDLLGKETFVLNGNRQWSKVVFKKYGTEKLFKILLSRNGRTKEIFATKNHRWFARNKINELTTENLLKGQRLDYCFPEYMSTYTKNYKFIIAGLIFGDGTIYNKHRKKQFSKAILYGEKDTELKEYFEGYNILEKQNYSSISGFPIEYKLNMPNINDDVDNILSWIAGYFAADGDVSDNGVPCINSSNKKSLIFLRDLCTKCGIGTYGISEYYRKGINDQYSFIYRLNFIPETLHSDLFLNKTHKERFLSFNKSFSRKRWVVVSVEETNRIEDVYCCEEPITHSFTLEDNILTGNCHNCGWKGNVRAFVPKQNRKTYLKPDASMLKEIQRTEAAVAWFEKRGISKETLEKFMIFTREEFMPQTQKKQNCICFPYFRDGEMVNIKFRDGAKNFKMVKDAELIFYNLQTIGDKKKVIITEGEIDCLSAYEAGMGHDLIPDAEGVINPLSEYAVISVPNGASKGNQRLEYMDNCSDWLIGIHEFIIATDNDEAGKLLKDELVRRLGVERCKIVSYPLEEVVPLENGMKRRCKDFNEILMYLGKDVIINCVENSEYIPVDGVYYLEDIFSSMLENFHNGIQLAPTTRFSVIDEYFRWKKGEINLCTGYGNHGKSFFMLQLMLTKSIWDGWKWAIFSPENYPANDFYDDLIEMYAGKWLNQMTEEEYVNASFFINNHIFYVYPENEHDINSIHEKFRYLVMKKGVDGVMIDPFNQLDHLFKPYQREDQYLSEILKDIKRFALLNNVCYNIVAHPKNPSYNQDKSLPVVDMYDISGGSMWGNKTDNIISYYRPNFHLDKNSPEVEIYVQKIKRKRTGGQLGHCPLVLVWSKKRYSNVLTGEMPCDPMLLQKREQSTMFNEDPF